MIVRDFDITTLVSGHHYLLLTQFNHVLISVHLKKPGNKVAGKLLLEGEERLIWPI